MVEIHNLKTGKQIVLYGPAGEPRYKEHKGESFPNGIKGFTDVQVTDKYIYALFDGMSWEERHQYYKRGEEAPNGGHFIYMFDLKGKPIRKYILDKNIMGFEIDEKRNMLIATCAESDEPIILYNL